MKSLITLFFILLTACSANMPEPITVTPVECVDTTTERPYLWRTDLGDTGPRGRLYACDTCATVEESFYERGAVLGCTSFYPAEKCTLTGACDYAFVVDEVTAVELARTCEELEDAVDHDPCTRPNAAHYWRPESD